LLGATNLQQADFVIQLQTDDPFVAKLTAAQIATGIWQDTTAGDFTTALSVGKSVMNGVSLGTGLTVNALTTNNDKTGYALSSAGVQAIWDALTSALTTVGSIGKLSPPGSSQQPSPARSPVRQTSPPPPGWP
jgi:hypothetical protein